MVRFSYAHIHHDLERCSFDRSGYTRTAPQAASDRVSENRSRKQFFSSNFGQRLAKLLDVEEAPNSPDQLFRELSAASKNMDAVVARIQQFTRGREEAVRKLEHDLGMLVSEEQQLQKRISELRDVPLPAVEYFATLVSKGERRSAFRDYGLFTAGVIVSAVVTIVLKHFGLA